MIADKLITSITYNNNLFSDLLIESLRCAVSEKKPLTNHARENASTKLYQMTMKICQGFVRTLIKQIRSYY